MVEVLEKNLEQAKRMSQTVGPALLASDIPVLDISKLDSLLTILTFKDLTNMLSLYVTGSRSRLDHMLETHDDDAIAHEAHDLKSNSGIFGFRRVETLARRIEYICLGTEEKMPLQPLLSAICDEYNVALKEIDIWKQKVS